MDSIKTFTAQHLVRQPHIVYRTADREGAVQIEHNFYKDRIFILSCQDRGENQGEENHPENTQEE